MPDISFGSQALYGILATEKSFLLDIRKLVEREHAFMLASKVCGRALPMELVDIVADQLYQPRAAKVEAEWKPRMNIKSSTIQLVENSDEPLEAFAKLWKDYEYNIPEMPAHKTAFAKIVSLVPLKDVFDYDH